MTETYPWDALSPEAAYGVFEGFGAPWWIAGGWAIDLYLGRKTREHGDIDLAALRCDQPRLQQHLRGWDIHVAHDGVLTPWADGDWLVGERHQFWVRRDADAAWSFEVLLEDSRDGEWLFRRDASITLPLEQFGRPTPAGIPFIAPEIALLYKAARATEIDRNMQDFAAAAPALDPAARTWLREALAALYPGHEWIARLN